MVSIIQFCLLLLSIIYLRFRSNHQTALMPPVTYYSNERNNATYSFYYLQELHIYTRVKLNVMAI